jgi:hypothetical protein
MRDKLTLSEVIERYLLSVANAQAPGQERRGVEPIKPVS